MVTDRTRLNSPRVTTPNTDTTTTTPTTAATTTAPATTADPVATVAATTTNAPTDVYDTRPLPVDDPLIPTRTGLPDVLYNSANAKVVHGTDPGDYYCEHMFFSTQRVASQDGSSVLLNRRAEPMVGFLHVSGDRWTSGGTDYTQAQRHAGTREVIGSAIRGYYEEASRQVTDGPVRMLVTGYDTFMSTTNNPTGEFVNKRENIDAAMREAFGDRLRTPEGELLTESSRAAAQYRYRVYDQATMKERDIVVCTRKFPVDDTAIDGVNGICVQKLMQEFKPHAVISMGVTGWSVDKAEFHADSGGLHLAPIPHHDDSARSEVNLPDNYSLARAIFLGNQARNPLNTGVIALHNRPQ